MDSRAPLAPIPPMPAFYPEAERRDWLRRIFDDTAPDYDRFERFVSLGSGPWYRRQALARAGLAPGMQALDVATGTGLVAREALRLVGPSGRITGVDPSEGMLESARRLGIAAVTGYAESLPFPDASFDFVSMGYALRHVGDLRAALAEFRRVLKPGGRLCILEISRPRSRAGAGALHLYMRSMCAIALAMGRSRPRTGELWDYYWKTIDACVKPALVLEALRDAGFDHPAHRTSLGVFSEYTAARPSNSPAIH